VYQGGTFAQIEYLMAKRKKKVKGLKEWQVIVIIAFGFLILILGFWWWYQNYKKTEAEKKARRELLEHRRVRLQKIILKKRGLSEKLRKWFEWGYFTFRVILVLLVLLFNFIVYHCNLPYYKTANLNDWLGIFLTYTGAIGILISLIIFIVYKNPATLSTAIVQMKDKLETFVYKKYLGIDKAIETNEIELKKIEEELVSLDEEEKQKKIG
jgi:hypothetical protein